MYGSNDDSDDKDEFDAVGWLHAWTFRESEGASELQAVAEKHVNENKRTPHLSQLHRLTSGTYVRRYAGIYLFVHVYVCAYVHQGCICIYWNIICVHKYSHVCAYAYVRTCTYVGVCVYVQICTYMHM